MLRATRRRWFTAMASTVVLVGLAAGCTAPSQQRATATKRVMGAGFSFDGDIIGMTAAQRNADLDRAKAMGATWVRLPFNWSTLQMHGRGTYNWAPGDALVAAANARGLKIDAVVSYAPGWARPAGSAETAPPSNAADYGSFLGAAAARYSKMGVHTWEIWNEPNLFTMWAPRPDVAKYTSLLKAAYPRIKAADPYATVLTGGTSPAYDAPDGSQQLPLTWLKGIYRNGGKGYFDAVAHHPSTFPYSSYASGDWNSFQQSRNLYAYMQLQGDGNKKVWATEIGFPTGTHNRAVTETMQGERFAESLSAWRNFSFAGPVFLYQVRDNGDNQGDVYQTFGMYRHDGRAKASVPRVTQAMNAMKQ